LRQYLLLRIGPARNLDDHVQNGLLGIGIEGDVVEGRNGNAILLNVHAVLERVRSPNLADAVLRRHCA
jgi:hypothetical protein